MKTNMIKPSKNNLWKLRFYRRNTEIYFSDLLKEWQNHNEIRLKEGTKLKYTYMITAHIAPELGKRRLKELTGAEINDFLKKKLFQGRLDGTGGLSPSYVKSMAVIISSALSFAENYDFGHSIKGRIQTPVIPPSEKEVLPLCIQQRLEKECLQKQSPTHIGIMLSLYGGLRIGEVCALQWKDLDLENRIIAVQHTVSRQAVVGSQKTVLVLASPKTPSSRRKIPIPLPLLELLLEYRQRSSSDFLVTDRETFLSPRTFEARFHTVLSKCGVPQVNYHVLRHTFATRCIEAGMDVKSLSEILGHSSPAITLKTYVHSSMEMKLSQIDKLSALCRCCSC